MNKIALDIGNVLMHFNINYFTEKLANRMSVFQKDAHFFLETIQPLQDNNLTTVYSSLRNTYHANDSAAKELVNDWCNTLKPSEIMLKWVQELKASGVKVALLSNMGPEHLDHMRRYYSELFKDSIHHISCEVGARKPTKLFYQSFIRDNPEFKNALYLDDIEENIKQGNNYNFRGQLFNLIKFSKLELSDQLKELEALEIMIRS
jgi:FMN phosphatase YigB (HAD superfamily)